LEIARQIDYVVFDKTGALASGEFGVNQIEKNASSTLTENELLALAGSVEVKSQHSIAQGIVNEVKKRNMTIFAVSNFKSFPGKGAHGTVNKKTVDVGNATYLRDLHINIPHSLTESKGNTPVYLVIDGTFAAVIYVSDMIRDESKSAIARLHAMGIKTAMLTGDAQDVAEAVGKTLGVDTIFAQVLPDDKGNKIKELQHKGHIVAMVGDGVNDAPSLTQAHVGIAIGAGTDVAVESADIVLMKNDPLDVVKAIHLSRKTNEKMVQNLIWATGYNIIAIPMAAGVFYSAFGIILRPEWAALLMSASSVIVVFNALLLRKAGI